MIPGLDLVVASHLILAGYTPQCVLKQAPEIMVRAKGVDREIDNTKSIKDLNTFKPMLNSAPLGTGDNVHVEGLTNGRIGMDATYEFSSETWPALSQTCLYVKKVTVVITLDPKIYVAREYAPGTCHYNAVLQHEMKHFRVDRDVVNKYSNIILQELNNTLKRVGYKQGPFPAAQTQPYQQSMGKLIATTISSLSDIMNQERQKRQAGVDTLEEYRRVDALCLDKPRLR